jgi:hypothetical protein
VSLPSDNVELRVGFETTYYNNSKYYSCIRFPRLTIVQKSTIYSARLYALLLYNNPHAYRLAQTSYWRIVGDNDPPYPSTGPDLLARGKYTERVHVQNYFFDLEMTPDPPSWIAGYGSAKWAYWDVTDMLQEAVDDEDFLRLDPLMFVSEEDGFPTIYPAGILEIVSEAWVGAQYGPFLEVSWQYNRN